MVYPILYPFGDRGWNYAMSIDVSEPVHSVQHDSPKNDHYVEDAENGMSSESDDEESAENNSRPTRLSNVTQKQFYSSKFLPASDTQSEF